ncbi:MAG: LacI family DNA-binding transcriptional regulator [Spirochaetes bacterium]|nr:LacI family DNA-binding transcriptional regulator [Spirochaetota bacterium]MBL7006054.1 LacI family DNA-binding transcriptional regulator [Spirochaetia bacterium]
MASTIKDIAEYAKVSITTVSRVLNNRPDVKEETRKLVNDTIKKLGYSPNIVARGLVLKRSNIIGFIIPDITNPSFPELARGIVNKARSHGFSVMFYDTNHDQKVEKEAIRLLRSKQVDGIILSFNEANKDELEKLREEHFPVVQIYRKSEKSCVSTIALDNVKSGYTATKYLIENGHRIIGHITTGEQVQSGSERLKGYRMALIEAGIAYREELIRVGANDTESGYSCMGELLALRKSSALDAVFVSHDTMAAGAYDAILSSGLRIPADISIISHDNNPISRQLFPKLTTMDTLKYRLGEIGVELLIKEMVLGIPQNREILQECVLIERNSVWKRDTMSSAPLSDI